MVGSCLEHATKVAKPSGTEEAVKTADLQLIQACHTHRPITWALWQLRQAAPPTFPQLVSTISRWFPQRLYLAFAFY